MFLEEASVASYQMLPKKLKKKMEKSTIECKTMSESEVNERETFTHW
jgi:hypothetical protein